MLSEFNRCLPVKDAKYNEMKMPVSRIKSVRNVHLPVGCQILKVQLEVATT